MKFTRLKEFFRSRQVERDLTDEIQHHLDLLTDDYVRRGYSRDNARAAARRAFGGVDQAKEAMRDGRGFARLDVALRDARYAIRLLAKTPGFTFVAVLTLGLGIGANAAIFSLVDGVLLRPLPYAGADRLVAIWELSRPRMDLAPTRTVVAPADLDDFERARGIQSLGAYSITSRTLTGAGDPERVFGEVVTAGYFRTLDAQPALGRLIQDSDAQAGSDRVVVLSHDFWRVQFGSDPGIVGRVITMNDAAYRVIGVTADGFRAVTAFAQADAGRFWIPAVFDADVLTNHADHEVDVVARLAPGVAAQAARGELQQIAARLSHSLPSSAGVSDVDLAPLGADISRAVGPMLQLLFGAVGLILLIACVNVANLLIVRGLGRRREIAVRLALGASRARVAAELLVHSLVLSALGGIAGVLFAAVTMRWLVALAPATIPRLDAVTLDWRVLLFAAGLVALVGVAFGLLPLRQVSRARPADVLASGDRVVAHAWTRRWRSALVVVELALSLVLLIGAGLMTRSLNAVNSVALGFNPDGVVAASVTLPDTRYTTREVRLEFFERVVARLEAIPGIRAAAFANRLPLRGTWSSGFELDPALGATQTTDLEAGFQAVSPAYFQSLGIPLHSGRLPTAADRDAADKVAVVSENFAAAFLGGRTPIGQRIRRGDKMPWITIVGTVGNIRRDGKTAAETPQVYLPAAQVSLYPLRLSDIAVRFDGDAAAAKPQVRAAIWAIDPKLATTNVRSLDEVISLKLAERQFQTFLFGLFAALAVVLALVGIHGVVAYAVLQRRAEIGIRLALGAEPRTILAWLLGQTLRLVIVGSAAGLLLSWALSRSLSSLLFNTAPTDLGTYLIAAVTLSLVALATSALAARSATAIDPTRALREN